MLLTKCYLEVVNMTDLDTVLSIIENPTRRRILEALVREPHYPLQLSRELRMSQQAIMKHLKVLEENNLVRSFLMESDRGGPARKVYVPIRGFSILVDVGPGLFNVEILSRENFDIESRTDLNTQEKENIDFDLFCQKYSEMRNQIEAIDKELEELQNRRSALIEKKERILSETRELVESYIGDYEARRVIYESVKHPTLTAAQIAKALGLRDEVVEEILSAINGRG